MEVSKASLWLLVCWTSQNQSSILLLGSLMSQNQHQDHTLLVQNHLRNLPSTWSSQFIAWIMIRGTLMTRNRQLWLLAWCRKTQMQKKLESSAAKLQTEMDPMLFNSRIWMDIRKRTMSEPQLPNTKTSLLEAMMILMSSKTCTGMQITQCQALIKRTREKMSTCKTKMKNTSVLYKQVWANLMMTKSCSKC